MGKANERQVAGTHYGLTNYQHWDMVVEHQLNYFQGQITKYVMRAPKKHGKQDLEKAMHFLEKYLEVYDKLHPTAEGSVLERQREDAEKMRAQEVSFKEPPLSYSREAVWSAGLEALAQNHFSFEGGYGNGFNLYKCRACGKAFSSRPVDVWDHQCGGDK